MQTGIECIGDVTEADRKQTPRRLCIPHYYALIRSGDAFAD